MIHESLKLLSENLHIIVKVFFFSIGIFENKIECPELFFVLFYIYIYFYL